MVRFLVTPRWMALHATMVIAIVACVALGWWQLGVYHDSRDREERRDLPAIPIEQLGDALATSEAEDRSLIVEGTYLADDQLLVPGRIHDDVLGSYVVTPLRTETGWIVPVMRGWVDSPDDTAAAAIPETPVEVTGHLLPPESSDHATVRSDQELASGQVGYIAPGQIADRTGLAADRILPGYLLLDQQTPEPMDSLVTLDVDTVAPIRDVNAWQNLSYWAQWWVFAGAAVVFWSSVIRSGIRSRRTPLSAPAESPVPS